MIFRHWNTVCAWVGTYPFSTPEGRHYLPINSCNLDVRKLLSYMPKFLTRINRGEKNSTCQYVFSSSPKPSSSVSTSRQTDPNTTGEPFIIKRKPAITQIYWTTPDPSHLLLLNSHWQSDGNKKSDSRSFAYFVWSWMVQLAGWRGSCSNDSF